ncbi:complement C1q-like protein 4 isoform X2 [Mytilus californianus]|uniref:complement C1q-like protein 4 isoform X2 n=1 Tax=Mytilus californianus TaxID=6549 RepID=UPI002247753B|nr:complement C1q-like protein 4 isoform X2 [Mytilus californianus]
MKVTVQFILAFLTMSVSVSGDCDAGKTTCITEDLLQMFIRVNRQSDIKPERPGFLAFVKNHPTLSNNVIKFDDVEINIGNHYNPTTGVFTAPGNGLYVLSSMIMAYGSTTIQYEWRKNDSIFSYGYTDKAYSSFQSQTFIFELKKGDRIYIKHRTSSSEKLHGVHYLFLYLLISVSTQ